MKWLIPIWILLICLPLDAMGMEAHKVEKKVLDNGLVILTKESRANDIIAVEVFLRLGTVCETDEQAGISTLLQSLLQKGTTTRTASRIAIDIEQVGGKLSTFAERDYSGVALLVTKNGLKKGLEVLFDVLRNSIFPEDQLNQEKKIQLQQIQARQDEFLPSAFDLLQETHYGKHPYHKPRLGYPETVGRFTREDVLKFYRAYYVPNNLIFSIVGNFDTKEVVRLIRNEFAGLPSGTLPETVSAAPPALNSPQEKFLFRESHAAWLVIGYPAPHIRSEDFAVMEVLDSIMGGSMNSRLFVELRDKQGLAYQIGSSYIPRTGPSFFAAFLGTEPEKFERAKVAILKEVEKFKTELVEEEELKRAKTYICGTFIMKQESNAGQASMLAQYELEGLGHDYVERYPEEIKKVGREDILRAAQEYFKNWTLSAVLPKPPEK